MSKKKDKKVKSIPLAVIAMQKENNQLEDSKFVVKLDESQRPFKPIIKRQKAILIITIIILILLLLLNLINGIFIYTQTITKQIGLIALVDSPYTPDVPDWDPNAIVPPDDDIIEPLNEKLDMNMMCINMAGSIALKNTYSTGLFNFFNDPSNHYPQFVTLTLDSNDMTIYQSGLVEVGKCIKYATLDCALPAGAYTCTATFIQVDTETMKPCGKAAAKIIIQLLE